MDPTRPRRPSTLAGRSSGRQAGGRGLLVSLRERQSCAAYPPHVALLRLDAQLTRSRLRVALRGDRRCPRQNRHLPRKRFDHRQDRGPRSRCKSVLMEPADLKSNRLDSIPGGRRSLGKGIARRVADPGQGRRKTGCVPMRRQMTCASPARTSAPYTKVARPSAAQVISHTPG